MDAAERDAWAAANRLFAELMELDPAQRAQRLAALTIAADVRERLTQLLAHMQQPHAWLDEGAIALSQCLPAADADSAAPMRGRRMGVWEIDGEIGRGGMAVVYRAHRIDGAVEQVAALKLLTVASLGRNGAEQFRRETDILARLAHPHIVGLLDAGIAGDGTPWLTMPLVEGVHIDRWCDQQMLDTRAVVTLFLQVAAAVSAAHRHLVIHRDLKPSNVIVDADGQAHLLDFGIARLGNEADPATRSQWRALTPQYAAPEQFTQEPPTTATDIHGLGALLYRLLTGLAPRTSAHAAAVPRPSRAAADGTAWTRHLRALRCDLDRVLLKALATDPAQRYGTVDELIADLQRWLAGRPVQASAPGRRYRMRKFIARHRLGVAAAAALALTLAAGTGGTVWQAGQARAQAAKATAIRDFVLDLFAAANPDLAQGEDPPASSLLTSGAARVRREFAARPLLLGEMLGMIGRVQLERGLLDDAQASLDDAIAAFEQQATPDAKWAVTAGDRGMLAYERGSPPDALRRLHQADAVAVAAGLAPTRPERLHLLVRIAEMLVETDQNAAAEDTARNALRLIADAGASASLVYPDALCVLATSLHHQGRAPAALDVLRQAEAAQQRIAPAHPKMAVILNDLALLLHRLGRHPEAEATMQHAIERHQHIYGALHPQTLHVMANRASLLRAWRGPAASAREYERLLPLAERALGSDAHSQRVNMLGQLAVARDEAGEHDAALQAAREAWGMQLALSAEQRERTDWVAGVLGLMLFQRADPAAGDLFARYQPPTCETLETRTAFTRHLCIARALLAADAGACSVPPATPPQAVDIDDKAEKNWWLAWRLLEKRCADHDAVGVDAAIAALGRDRELPRWLAMRLERASAD